MAVSVGVIVANIYYAQPLLADISRTFHLSVTAAGPDLRRLWQSHSGGPTGR